MNRYIDHTLLKPEAGPKDILKLVDEAVKHGFRAVCVNPVYVSLARKRIASQAGGSPGVRVCTVVGFPLGSTGAKSKELETLTAITDGADEIDVVISVGQLKAGALAEVSVRSALHHEYGGALHAVVT